MNQPIILDYIKQQNIHESQLSEILSKTNYNDTKETKEYKRGLKKYKNEIIADLKTKYGTASIGDRELTKSELEESIKGNINNALQVKVLDDFIRYQQAAKELKDAIQGSTYDTSGLGGDMNELSYKLALTNRVMNVGNFINFDKLMNSGFISPYFEAAKSAEQIFAPLYTIHNNPVLKASYLEVLNQFFNREYPIGRDRVTGVLNKYTDYLLSYIITSNKGYKINNTIENKALTSEIERLFTGENSIPRRTLELQKVLPNNALIQAMKVTLDVTGEYGIDGMGLASSKRDTLTSNTYTENFRELFQSNQAQYAEDLMKFILLQSGLNYSPISMVDLIPYEKYSEVFGYAMSKKVSPDEINQFTNLTFKREAYEDDDIVPKKKVRNKAAQVFSKKYDKLAKFLNKGIDINSLIARGVQVFKLKPTLTDVDENKVTPNSVKRYREKVSLLDLSDKTNTVVQNSSEENILKYSKENLDSKKQVAQELKMKCK